MRQEEGIVQSCGSTVAACEQHGQGGWWWRDGSSACPCIHSSYLEDTTEKWIQIRLLFINDWYSVIHDDIKHYSSMCIRKKPEDGGFLSPYHEAPWQKTGCPKLEMSSYPGNSQQGYSATWSLYLDQNDKEKKKNILIHNLNVSIDTDNKFQTYKVVKFKQKLDKCSDTIFSIWPMYPNNDVKTKEDKPALRVSCSRFLTCSSSCRSEDPRRGTRSNAFGWSLAIAVQDSGQDWCLCHSINRCPVVSAWGVYAWTRNRNVKTQ